jgi:hypothetical protein
MSHDAAVPGEREERAEVLGHDFVVGPGSDAAHLVAPIQQLTARYAFAIDSRNVALMASLFSPRSSFGKWGRGQEGAAQFFETAWGRFGRSAHLVTNVIVTPTADDEAKGIVYCHNEHQLTDGTWETAQIAYFDSYVREEDSWLFMRRQTRFWYRETPAGRELGNPPTIASARGSLGLPEAWPTWDAFWGRRETSS